MAMPGVHLEASFVARIAMLLERDGWIRQPDDEPRFDLTGSPDVNYGLSLNIALHGNALTPFPALGVRSPQASALYAEFYGSTFKHVAAFGVGLADLMPHAPSVGWPHRRWAIENSTDIDSAAVSLSSDVERHAVPFFRSFHTLHDIVAKLESLNKNSQVLGQLMICYALLDDIEEARHALQEFNDLASVQPPRARERSLLFVRLFTDHFGTGVS